MNQPTKIDLQIIVSAILLCFAVACSSQKRDRDGWGGPPTSPHKEPFDYFYLKLYGNASVASYRIGDMSAMKASCQAVAKLAGGTEVFRAMIYDSIGFVRTGLSEPDREAELMFDRHYRKRAPIEPFAMSCVPVGREDIPWEACECDLSFHQPEEREKVRVLMLDAAKRMRD